MEMQVSVALPLAGCNPRIALGSECQLFLNKFMQVVVGVSFFLMKT